MSDEVSVDDLTSTLSIDDVSITIDPEAVEPNQYFKILKSRLKTADTEMLEKQLTTLGEHIYDAKKIGQTSLIQQFGFAFNCILKEQQLLAVSSNAKIEKKLPNGTTLKAKPIINRYVHKDDVKKFIDKAKPKNSIKIIELERYPRVIPSQNAIIIAEAKQWNLFDGFVVVFTDLSDNDYKTPKEKEYVKRNRDPIVFGYFDSEQLGIHHDRWYFITDWEDEHCDLTFAKMIEQMSEQGIKNPSRSLVINPDYINQIIKDATPKEVNSLEQIEGKRKRKKPWYWPF